MPYIILPVYFGLIIRQILITSLILVEEKDNSARRVYKSQGYRASIALSIVRSTAGDYTAVDNRYP
jgi:predicted histidine transporter YuiF (NhaC family)